jgi:hypothetical protein
MDEVSIHLDALKSTYDKKGVDIEIKIQNIRRSFT